MIRFVTKADVLAVKKLMVSYKGDWISDTEYLLDYIDNHDFYAVGNFDGEQLMSFVLLREIPEQKFAILHLFFADPALSIYKHRIHEVYDFVLLYLQTQNIWRYYTVLKQAEAESHMTVWHRLSKEREHYDVYLEERIPAYEFSLYNQYQSNMLNGKLKSECSEIYHYVLREEFRK